MPSSRIPRKLVYLAIALFTSFFLACNFAPKESLKIGADIWPGFEPLYLARDLGYFEDAPIQIVEYTGMKEIQQAFRNGTLDMKVDTLDSFLLLARDNPDMRVWLLFDVSKGGDALVAQADIQDLQDLEGRTVGLYPDDLSVFILTRALESVDLPLDAVNRVVLEAAEQKKAFLEGEVDAIVTFEPTRSRLLEGGANLLFDSRQMPGEIIDVLVGAEDIKHKFPQELKVLVKGWFKALQYIQENPDDAMQRMAKRQGITLEQFTQSLDGLSFINLQNNQALLSRENPELYEGVKRLTTFLSDRDLLDGEVDLDNLFDDRFVKAIDL